MIGAGLVVSPALPGAREHARPEVAGLAAGRRRACNTSVRATSLAVAGLLPACVL